MTTRFDFIGKKGKNKSHEIYELQLLINRTEQSYIKSKVIDSTVKVQYYKYYSSEKHMEILLSALKRINEGCEGV